MNSVLRISPGCTTKILLAFGMPTPRASDSDSPQSLPQTNLYFFRGVPSGTLRASRFFCVFCERQRRSLTPQLRAWRLSRSHQRRALGHGNELAHLVPQIDLTRARDLLLGIVDQLLPLRQPSHGTGNRKEHGEHFRLETDRLVDDPRIKIHVGI